MNVTGERAIPLKGWGKLQEQESVWIKYFCFYQLKMITMSGLVASVFLIISNYIRIDIKLR